ncbi:MAG: PEP-CTERM sorting domain-containing protein [Rubripirellula sp.]
MILRIAFLVAIAISGTSLGNSARGDMMFNVVFSAQAQSDLSASEQSLFTDALSFWDDIIIDHRDGVSRNWTLGVDTFSQAASGGGVLLGSAGPSGVGFTNPVSGVTFTSAFTNSGFLISTGGNANFNVHADAGGLSSDTIKHEIGHALGIGTLWEDNEVYNDEGATPSNRTLTGGIAGQYVGAAALAAYQAEVVGQSAATFVPVELSGGSGTAHGHWDESDNFGQTPTGVLDIWGRDRKNELMTGYAAPGTDFISNTTIMSLYDIGFNVNLDSLTSVTAVPEPSSLALIAIGFAITGTFRTRTKKRSAA